MSETKPQGRSTRFIASSGGTISPGGGEQVYLTDEALDRVRAQLAVATRAGLISIGQGPTWQFPDSSDAPKRPDRRGRFMGTELFIPNCVPDLNSSDYAYWSDIRDGMWADLVASLPELDLWMVGGDTTLGFGDCSGRPMTVADHVDLFADALQRIARAVHESNPSAQVIAHFLGNSTLSYAGETIQPRDLQALLLSRLDESPYDLLVSDLVPALLADRHDRSGFLNQGLTQPGLDGGAMAQAAEPSVGGWHLPPVLEEFDTSTSDLTATYNAWQDFLTDTGEGGTTITDIEVPSPAGQALLRLVPPDSSEDHESTVAGAVSTGVVDFIPDQHFAGAGSTSTNDPTHGIESDLWVFVSDFFPDVGPDPSGPHVVAFLRVHDRENWQSGPNQTRFGSILFGPHNTAQCGNELGNPSSLAALQITSDKIGTNETEGLTYLHCFGISDPEGPDDPWDPDNTNKQYRVSIFEKKINQLPLGQFKVFKAQVHRLDENLSGVLLGESPWITQLDIVDFGMTVPISLTNSRVFWGYGPRFVNNTISGVDVERVGSTYWDYNQ